MFEINVIEKGNKQWLSARDLYASLGASKENFSRWANMNIVDSCFKLNKDFYSSVKKTKGRPAQDYMLTVDTAMHVSLMSNTEKGYEIRERLIETYNAFITGDLKQIESETAERINYLEKAVDQRDVYISTIINEAQKIMPKDPIGTESKKTGRPRLNLRRACYVSAKKDDPKQLVFGFDINN